MSYDSVGLVWDPVGFAAYLRGENLSWAKGVTLHHTAAPSLAQRPNGFTIQHMRNLASYYGTELGWSAGPHLFVDEDQIFGLSPISAPGTHARSFNRSHIGIEVLGNYDHEDPDGGRGLECWKTAGRATAAILARLGLGVESVNFHRDDPLTSKTCPGRKVDRERFLDLVSLPATDDRTDPPPTGGAAVLAQAKARIDAIQWQLNEMRRLLELR